MPTMVSHADDWIRIYDIPETSQHKKGFTLYKVISMLYPERCPDAVTKITVWKRYNEFKKLHRELKSKHRSLRLSEKFPLLPNHPFFKRFNADVITERRIAILTLLEYVAKQPELFTSDVFVKFFESSHTPSNMLCGSINSIRADLHLPGEPEYLSYTSISSDEEHTLSDTDSISTLSSLNTSPQVVDLLSDPLSKTSMTKLCKKISTDSLAPVSEDASIHSSTMISTPSTPHETSSLLSANFTSEYIVEAAHYITEATEMEIAKSYENAFAAYKQGIDILLNNVRYDTDIDRREKVRFKVEKYLLRAEKIYNMYLSPEIKQINEITKSEVQSTVLKPLAELYKYKAIKIIESGMLVIHSETQELFFVKAIHKTCKYSSDYLILPDNVPYMIKLHNYYDCENAIFLILQYSCGTKLLEHLKRSCIALTTSSEFNGNYANSDNDSEGSYSDLINEYAASKFQIAKQTLSSPTDETKIEKFRDTATNFGKSDLDSDNIFTKSQSSCATAQGSLCKQTNVIGEKEHDEPVQTKEVFQRKLSERSVPDDIQFRSFNANVDDVIKWAAQLLLALEKLHVLGVICCDLDLNNILVDENGDLILTYMCSLSQDNFLKTDTNLYVAPELFTYNKVSCAVDWWSYGSILYELLVGVSLKSVHPEGITSYFALKVPKYVSPEGRSLLKQLLVYEPAERLGCGVNGTDDIKTHPFFNSISWEHLADKYIQ